MNTVIHKQNRDKTLKKSFRHRNSASYTHKKRTQQTQQTQQRQQLTQKTQQKYTYSEGFIRRLTAPLVYTIIESTPELDKLFPPVLTEDEEFELFVASQRRIHTSL